MSENLIPIKDFLGKYYTELLYSAAQEKYKDTKLDSFFDQRFYVQDNKIQMIVDPSVAGLVVVISGNEIQISKELYDHTNVVISNTMEGSSVNPRALYNPETFSTLAYLVCQNQTTFRITGEIDEPIYIKYKSDYESFYNSVVVFDICNGIHVEIVEEIESYSALNAVTNYALQPYSKLNLMTFYRNNVSAHSFCYRHILAQDNSSFNHVLLGKGSANIIDESKIRAMSGSNTEMLGIVHSDGKNFHSILSVEPISDDYSITVNYKDVLEGKADVTFFPVILGQLPVNNSATIEVSNLRVEDVPLDKVGTEIKDYVSDIIDRAILERMAGVTRFYDNKSKFLDLL
jgi:hypothetical protein